MRILLRLLVVATKHKFAASVPSTIVISCTCISGAAVSFEL